MKQPKLFNRLKSALTCAAVAVTALAAPMAVTDNDASAAVNINYAKALQYSLYLYDANMCGPYAGETSQLDWRDDCHTYDSNVSTPYGMMDLSGGFHDAGDHVKFGLPAAYSATVLGWGYYEFKDAFVSTGQADHLRTITDYFCDYFKKCTVMNGSSVRAFCYQVGDGDTDHARWESPESQTISRPVYFADSSNPCTDVVAETAAALAMNYINFGNSEDLSYAKALYDFAKSNNKANHKSQSFYTGSSYLDDLALAAILLYKATDTWSYQSDCSNWINQSNWSYTTDYPLNWDGVWPAVNAIYGNEWNRVSEFLDKNKNSYNTSEGYSCRSDWGSARYNTANQFMGLVYDSHKGGSSYSLWAKGQMEYLFGDNRLGNCYMVGYDSNSVLHPHHRAASGRSTFPPTNDQSTQAHVLVGALVGGPDKNGTYQDYTDSYTYTEVALDYNAAFVGALAGLYLKYGSGQSVSLTVPGVSGGYTTPTEPPVTEPPVTEPPVTTVTTTVSDVYGDLETTTTTTVPYSPQIPASSERTLVVNETLNYSGNNRMLQVPVSDLLPENAKAEKIIVNMSANGDIGYPSVGGGISISDPYNSWKDLSGNVNVSGNSGKIEFDVTSVQDNISRDGIFQLGYWWGNQTEIRVDSIVCIYTMESAETTPITTAEPYYETETTTTIEVTTEPYTESDYEGTTTIEVTTQPYYENTTENYYDSTTSITVTNYYQETTSIITVTTVPYTTAETTSAVTNNSGNQANTNPGMLTWVIWGDVNESGAIHADDIVMLNLYLIDSYKNNITIQGLVNANCVYDNYINSDDSSAILQFVAEVIPYSMLGKYLF